MRIFDVPGLILSSILAIAQALVTYSGPMALR